MNLQSLFCGITCLIIVSTATAQKRPIGTTLNENGDPIDSEPIASTRAEIPHPTPRDGFYDRTATSEKPILAYDHVREADVMWEKRIWREINLNEKMNQHFSYPRNPFITVIRKAADCDKITLYRDEEFTKAISKKESRALWSSVDTIMAAPDINNPDSMVQQIVQNDFDPTDIKKYRIKEVWFFDEETSSLKVRILGIAPITTKFDENGNALFEYPMFWMYYPDSRAVIGHTEAFVGNNDAVHLSWEDIFEMRYFGSTITKASNVGDKRISDTYSGRDALLEAQKIHEEIFNFEQDLWQD